MPSIQDTLRTLLDDIEQSARRYKRPPQSVQLLAVSKTKPAEDIEQAYAAGQRRFGENYVQEGVDKVAQLLHLVDIEWHFIGPLQSNKTRVVAEHFDWVQSVDRIKIAKRLNEQRPTDRGPLNVLLQVNISDEDSKSGVSIDDAAPLAAFIHQQPNLTLRGVMTIPAQQDATALMVDFARLHRLYEQLQAKYDTVDTLSMGMSGDMELAIEAGSTMVRIGTALFGARD